MSDQVLNAQTAKRTRRDHFLMAIGITALMGAILAMCVVSSLGQMNP